MNVSKYRRNLKFYKYLIPLVLLFLAFSLLISFNFASASPHEGGETSSETFKENKKLKGTKV